jgi:segregation and condensation protein B
VVGRRDAPGRPALYGTTPYFLEAFTLRALHELPALNAVAADAAAEGTAIEGSAGDPVEAALAAGAAAVQHGAGDAGDSGANPEGEDSGFPPLAPDA